MPLHPGERLGPYEVLAALGAGGMGEVYRARDTRLGREVAVKILPAQFASDPERLRRFEQEARAAAALNHPNILVLYDIGSAIPSLRGTGSPEAISSPAPGRPRPQGGPAVTDEGRGPVHYIVTELLEGESLRQRLCSGPLPPAKAVDFGVQVAQGLAAAHEKGIVHRDLKPENLFVTEDGHVKILDFGLARLKQQVGGEREGRSEALTADNPTREGAVLGTPGYMAPEQVLGQPCDHRADIFAFGCVLDEVLTGKKTFGRDNSVDTLSAILHDTPPPPSVVAAVPPPLDALVLRCLEKRPEERYQSARDIALELRALLTRVDGMAGAWKWGRLSRRWRPALWAAGAIALGIVVAGAVAVRLHRASRAQGTTGPSKIVVFPFENLGPPEQAYFAAGMADEISSRLASVAGLAVMSRTSAVQYNRSGKTMKQVGHDLGVDYVLEGSVRWERGPGAASRVRITPELIRVADDTQVWTDRYDRVLSDVFAIQTEVAEGAVKAMGLRLLPREASALKEVATRDLEAYDLYLRGKACVTTSAGSQSLMESISLFQAAVDRDPRFVQALAKLAWSHLAVYWLRYDRSQEHVLRAKEAAERAVSLRPDLPDGHTALGWYHYYARLDYPRALEEFGKALEIQPNSDWALYGQGAVLRRMGRWNEAAETQRKACELDPKNLPFQMNLAIGYALAGRYADADAWVKRATLRNPQWSELYAMGAIIQLIWHGDAKGATAILEGARGVPGLSDDMFYDDIGFRAAFFQRDYPGALRHLDASKRRVFESQWQYLPIPMLRAEVLRLAGREEEARRSFEEALGVLDEEIARDPGNGLTRSALGITYAGLGRRAEAVEEARRACDLMPASTDAWVALWRTYELAQVYTMVGRKAEAIAALDDLLGRSGLMTPPLIRLDPTFDVLHSDARFGAVLDRHEVKE